MRLVDINGDGLVDILRTYITGGTAQRVKIIYINNGTAWMNGAKK